MTLDKLLVLLGGLAAIFWIIWFFFLARRTVATATTNDAGVQQVDILVSGGYTPDVVRVRQGTPVRLVFDRRETNPCSEEIVLPDFGIRRFLPPGRETAVEFTPEKAGTFDFMCGMGMLHGKLVVE
jgi:plastocyanin domain-containing protein